MQEITHGARMTARLVAGAAAPVHGAVRGQAKRPAGRWSDGPFADAISGDR